LGVSAASTDVCYGGSTTIDVALSVVGVSYQLRNDADNSQVGTAVAGTGGTINLPTGNLTSTTTYNVLATNASTGCDAELSTMATVTVNPALSVVATTADNLICDDESTTLTATPSGGTGPYTYLWAGAGAGDLDDATLAMPTFTPSAAATYVFTVTVTDASASSCTAQSNVTVTVNATPATGLGVSAASTDVCYGGSTGHGK